MNDSNTDNTNQGYRKALVQVLRTSEQNLRRQNHRLRLANKQVKMLYAIKRGLKKTDNVEYAETCYQLVVARDVRRTAQRCIQYYKEDCARFRLLLQRK